MLTDEQLKEIRSKILMEDEQPQEKESIEPTVEEILTALDNGELDLETLEQLHQEGQISDETYEAVIAALSEEEDDNEDPADIIQRVIDGYNNGEISDEDINNMLQNGEIDDDTYNKIAQAIQENEESQEPVEVPAPIAGKYNQAKLFTFFMKLKKCIELYIDSYNDIELDQVSSFQMKGLNRAYKNIKELKESLCFYMEHNFAENEYKENLTQYITIQRDFADELRKFRHILKLNPDKLIQQQKEENEKNKKD